MIKTVVSSSSTALRKLHKHRTPNPRSKAIGIVPLAWRHVEASRAYPRGDRRSGTAMARYPPRPVFGPQFLLSFASALALFYRWEKPTTAETP
jgi:hypothetical protein